MKKLFTFALASLLSFTVLSLASTGSVFAAEVTWDGGGSDNKLSTGANWVGDTAPSAGDTIKFTDWSGDPDTNSNNISLVNDLNIAFAGVTGSGPGPDPDDNALPQYRFDKLTVEDGATLSVTDLNIWVDDLTAQGTVTIGNNIGASKITAQGSVKADAGSRAIHNLTSPSLTLLSGADLVTSSPAKGEKFSLDVDTLTIQKGAKLHILGGVDKQAKITSNISFGGGSGADPEIELSVGKGGPGSDTTSSNVITTGAITLSSNAKISLVNNEAQINGKLTRNGHTLTVVIDGDSRLKGTGQVGVVNNGGRFSPGTSPGCISTDDITFESGSSFEVEIAGTKACDEYDQTQVTGTVTISGGSIDVTFLDDFTPAKGDEFIIIKNDGSDAVDGTFKDLKEGDTFEVGDVTFKISYKGGDGNDVELSVLSAPDTGLYRDMAPLAPFAATGLTLSLVSAYFIRRKVTAGQ